MTQHFTNLGQRCAVAQHLGGKPVAKLMRTLGGRNDAGAFECMPNERSNGTLP